MKYLIKNNSQRNYIIQRKIIKPGESKMIALSESEFAVLLLNNEVDIFLNNKKINNKYIQPKRYYAKYRMQAFDPVTLADPDVSMEILLPDDFDPDLTNPPLDLIYFEEIYFAPNE